MADLTALVSQLRKLRPTEIRMLRYGHMDLCLKPLAAEENKTVFVITSKLSARVAPWVKARAEQADSLILIPRTSGRRKDGLSKVLF